MGEKIEIEDFEEEQNEVNDVDELSVRTREESGAGKGGGKERIKQRGEKEKGRMDRA